MAMTANTIATINQTEGQALRVFVLGRFEVEQGHRVIGSENWRSGKARSLFKIMLNRRGYQISRQEASELLWPELDQDRAANNLNQAVFSLRRTLEPGLLRAGQSMYLKTESTRIQLNPGQILWVDQDEFKRLSHQAQLSGDVELYEQATELYAGDYLPEDLYEDWSVYRRETLRQEWIELVLKMASLYQAHGQDEKYQQSLHRILESDFSHEESLQKLMQALAESGRREEALTLYRNFNSKLKARLNVEPLRETIQLHQEIASGKFNQRAGSGGLRAGSSGTGPIKDLSQFRETAMSFQPVSGSHVRTLPLAARQEIEQLKPPEVIARKIEQAAWQNTLKDALSGQGCLTLVAGEAGVGKSYLLDRLGQQARLAGFDVFQAQCYPEQSESPLAPISNLLQQALDRMDDQDCKEFFSFCHPAIFSLLPGMGHRTDNSPEINGGNGLPLVFAAITQALVWLARRRPIVLVLDELNCLTGPAVRLLQHLLTHNSLRRLVILAALRTVAPPARSVELNRLLNWAAEARQPFLRMARFDKNELQQLLTVQLGHPVAAGLLTTCFNAGQGNARLTVELAGAWSLEGQLRLVNGQWDLVDDWQEYLAPPPLISYIQRVKGTYSRAAQVVLELATLSGQAISFETLRHIVLHRPDGAGWWIELDKNQLGQALIELTGGGLIEERGSEYRISFPLLAEGLLAGMSHNQRGCWLEVIAWAQAEINAKYSHKGKVG